MKQKWYKSNITKAVLIILAHIMIITAVASFMWMLAYPTLREEILDGNQAETYSDTKSFQYQMMEYSIQAVSGIRAEQLFESDGVYNPNKMIDIPSLYEMGQVQPEVQGIFSYRLGDLMDWTIEETEKNPDEGIVVCRQPDNHFHYYTKSEFFQLINSGNLQLMASYTEEGVSMQELYIYMQDNSYELQNMFRGIQDPEGKMQYSDFWIYDGTYFPETFQPAGAGSIMEMANSCPEWNGRLQEAYQMLGWAISYVQTEYTNYLNRKSDIEEGNSNFTYIYADLKNQRIYTNKKAYEDFADLNANIRELCSYGKNVRITPLLADFQTNMDVKATDWRNQIKYSGLNEEDFLFAATVDTDYPIRDTFYTENELYEKYGSGAKKIAALFIVSVILFLTCVLWLIVIAGRSAKDQELHLVWFDRWKTELSALSVFLVWLVVVILGVFIYDSGVSYMIRDIFGQTQDNYSYIENSIPYIVFGAVFASFSCSMFLIGMLSLVRRIKAHSLWKDSVLKCAIGFAGNVFRYIGSVWQTILLFGAFAFVQLLFILSSTQRSLFWILIMFLADVAAFVYLVNKAIGKKKLKEGLSKIVGGEVEYKIPLQGLGGDQKEIAQQINMIGDGLDAALEKSIKSERLKTDLITNVSHDIKTPLTSIINYVELLKQENFQDPKLQRYIEILEQKSQRLKTLTEDVVEASKVSSGNITLEYININLTEMVQQSSGEFEEKFRARNLTEILTLPEEEAVVRADGRRTWRILENIYNNASKYAMEGTRVYADLKVEGEEVIFSLKNISEQALNISADELTERFIRGDLSRSSEGSGLGLSIAKTLTEMQGGKFELYLDGDLFKATVRFPRLRA